MFGNGYTDATYMNLKINNINYKAREVESAESEVDWYKTDGIFVNEANSSKGGLNTDQESARQYIIDNVLSPYSIMLSSIKDNYVNYLFHYVSGRNCFIGLSSKKLLGYKIYNSTK